MEWMLLFQFHKLENERKRFAANKRREWRLGFGTRTNQ